MEGRRYHDALARQVLGERLPCGPLALEGGDRGGLSRSLLGYQIVFRRVSLELLELELHLIEQAAATLGAGAIQLALQLGDLQLEMGDQRLDSALAGHGAGKLGLGLASLTGHRRHQRLERFDIVWKGRDRGFHGGE